MKKLIFWLAVFVTAGAGFRLLKLYHDPIRAAGDAVTGDDGVDERGGARRPADRPGGRLGPGRAV